jgi:hypothetical protein
MNTNIVMRKRIAVLLLLIAGILFLLIFRLGWLQFVRGEELQQKALDNRLREVPVEAKRGVIYDRNNRELALSISADSIGVFPAEVKHSGRAEEIAEELAAILDMPSDRVFELITKNSSFVWIKRKIDFEVGPQIRKLNLPGVEVIEESQRYYPNGTLAAHLLGFAGIDNQGLEGLEITHDDELKGKKGKILIEFDATHREIPEAVHKYISPEDGNSIVLTIDETIQYIVERELDNLIAETQAKSATVIVMDPKTGGILALANRPTYDPNKYSEYTQDTWRNIAVSNSYEPGSTFKIITTAQVQSKMVAQYPELQGPAGAIFSFRADLTNSSNKEQSYSLGANVPAGWEVAFKPSYEDKKIASISLEAEKNQGLDIEVKPPQNVKAGEYVIPISAVSADETIQNELKVIITGTYSLELTTPNGLLNFESTAGREKEITLVVKNTGSGDLHNVKLSARQPSNWLVNFEPEQIDLLKAEESREIKAIIKPDNKAIAGDYAVTLTASTQETSTNVDFRVIVKTSTLWGLVGVVIIGAMAYGLYHTFKVYGRR